MRKEKKMRVLAFLAVMFTAAIALGGCSSPTSGQTAKTTVTTTYAYAVDTNSGKVFQIDRSSNTAASSALVTIGQNAAGEIRFCGNTGFVAVGSYNNTVPGLYYFDASSSNPSAALIGTSMSAQYICIVSSSLGYVSVANYSAPSLDGVYSFNPSSPSSGLTQIYQNSSSFPQDIVVGSDGYVYVANSASTLPSSAADSILRIDSSGTVTTIAPTSSGVTGLSTGSYKGSAGVFVAETGGYTAGSIDFIASNATTVTPLISNASRQIFARAAQLDSNTLVATGGYPAKTYLVSLAGTPSATEVSYSGSSFGSSDVDIYNNIAYVPDGAQAVYAFGSSGSPVKISVGSSTERISNVGIGTITAVQ